MATYSLVNGQRRFGRRGMRGLFGKRSRREQTQTGVGLRILSMLALPVRVFGIPCVAGLASGAVRGQDFDQLMADLIARGSQSAALWLDTWMAPPIPWFLVRCLQFGLVGLGLAMLGLLVTRIPNFVPCIVVSEVARRQGRSTSAFDLMIAVTLPIALTVALTRYDQVSLIAWIWFCLAYFFCRMSFHPSRLGGFLDWVVKIRGPFDGMGGATGNGRNHAIDA